MNVCNVCIVCLCSLSRGRGLPRTPRGTGKYTGMQTSMTRQWTCDGGLDWIDDEEEEKSDKEKQ